METNLCLYNAMYENNLLDNMSPQDARQFYGRRVEDFVRQAYKTDDIPQCEILTNRNSMGSISILQAYLNEHPHMAFQIRYADIKTFFLFGAKRPVQIASFIHMGNVDCGHFIADRLSPDQRATLLKSAQVEFDRRQNK